MILVGHHTVLENYAHHYSTSVREKEILGENLRDAFYVATSTKWKYNVVRRGIVVLQQIIQYLTQVE